MKNELLNKCIKALAQNGIETSYGTIREDNKRFEVCPETFVTIHQDTKIRAEFSLYTKYKGEIELLTVWMYRDRIQGKKVDVLCMVPAHDTRHICCISGRPNVYSISLEDMVRYCVSHKI